MRTIFFFILMTFGFFGCSQKQTLPDTQLETDCGFIAIVNDSELRNAPRDPFTIVSTKIEGDCFEVTVRYGGGCGGADFKFIAGEALDDSMPPQREAVVSLKDEDNCEALVTETISFDLTPLRVENYREIIFNIEFINAPFLYKY